MFVSKKKHNALAKRISRLEEALGSMNYDLTITEAEVQINRLSLKDTIKALLLLNKKTQNLECVVRAIVKNTDRKKVVGETKEGVDITIGDVLSAEDLLPREEEEYQTAII